MKFAVLSVMVLLGACGDKAGSSTSASSGPQRKPHDPVKGPALYTIHLDDITVQKLGDGDKPDGDAKVVKERPGGKSACRIEKDPGSDVVTTWFKASFDDTGHAQMTQERDPSVPSDVVDCVIGPVINTKLGIGPGEYKVTVKAWFDEPQPQAR